MQKRNILVIGALALLVPVVAFAWWLLSPLFLTTTVDEEFPYAASAEIPSDMTMEEVETVMKVMAKMDQRPMEAPMAQAPMAQEMESRPVAVATGAFRDADSFHRGSGTATIYETPGGGHVLRFEEFMVTNGPDLRVLLAVAGDPMNRDELQAGGYTHLAKLKGNLGNQNYEIPAGINLDAQNSVIIYCMPFHVIFSVAPLQRAGQS